ncbi:nucleotide-binding protein [Gudongella sp. SC589]|uniref:nucleotide-binding protein n=1 Tax=Gudongella sp. SC589 TaxID=3385990 RepID=UPI003904AD64
MKQVLVLSGKGGTGKTTLSSSMIKLSGAKAYADCDVDAPNLHLALEETLEPKNSDFYGLPVAQIHSEKCVSCDLCRQKCRFDAINVKDVYSVDKYACEGCAVCQLVCPADAIEMIPRITGHLQLYQNDHVFSTAELCMGSGNSGLLVTEVKKGIKDWKEKATLAIIDGSPGIGCPVIASISGVDLVLLVTEPTLSGFSDMERIVETSRGFPAKIAVCINKYDLHLGNTEKIEKYCMENDISFLGRIPFDSDAVSLLNSGKTLVDKKGPARDAIEEILTGVLGLINLKEDEI